VHQFFGRNVLRDDLEQNSFVDLNERARVEPSQASALIEELRTRVGDGIGHAYNDMESSSMFQSIISHTGRKHAVFGVQASHFVAFGEALDMGLAMAIWSRVYPRDVAGMDRAL
jgi:hypothetical protein